jgi:hypothetical protein
MTKEMLELEAGLAEALTRPLNTRRQSWLDRVPLWASISAGAAGTVTGIAIIGAAVGLMTGAKF